MNHLFRTRSHTLDQQLRGIAFLICGVCLSHLASCSSSTRIQEFPDTANDLQELTTLEGNLKEASGRQVETLSPKYFRLSKEATQEARGKHDKQMPPREVLHAVALGNSFLSQANDFASYSYTNMEEVVVARQQALAIGADTLFPQDFKEADSHLQAVTSDIEKNRTDGVAKKRSELRTEFAELELRAMKARSLGKAKDLIKQATEIGAKEYAPQSLAIAQKSYDDTEAYITANPHNATEIQARAAESTAKANHLLVTSRAALNTKKSSPEGLALQLEAKQNQIKSGQRELIVERKRTDSLEEENEKLKNTANLNKRVNQVHSKFSEGEADVSTRGNVVTIRLKGLPFAASKTDLRASNFPLLNKVGRVIKQFDDPTVVVEGHSDSVGNKKNNNYLSQKRAQQVKEYLISNESIEKESIVAKGFGEQRPIASNDTAEGRAQNRRVDIHITPGAKQ